MAFNYVDSNIIQNKDNKRYRETNLYPKIEYQDTDIYIVTSRGERLDNYAYKYYNDASYWKVIAKANNLGKNSLVIPEGTRLRIPQNIEEIDRLFYQYNNKR